jgi:hypothetical protein
MRAQTSLALARTLVEAVLSPGRMTPERALLKALEQNGNWFCKLAENAEGLTIELPYARHTRRRRPVAQSLPFEDAHG